MEPTSKDARDLHKWMREHLPHVLALVGKGSDRLYLYVQSRRKHVKECPTEWGDFAVDVKWTGKNIPLSRP